MTCIEICLFVFILLICLYSVITTKIKVKGGTLFSKIGVPDILSRVHEYANHCIIEFPERSFILERKKHNNNFDNIFVLNSIVNNNYYKTTIIAHPHLKFTMLRDDNNLFITYIPNTLKRISNNPVRYPYNSMLYIETGIPDPEEHMKFIGSCWDRGRGHEHINTTTHMGKRLLHSELLSQDQRRQTSTERATSQPLPLDFDEVLQKNNISTISEAILLHDLDILKLVSLIPKYEDTNFSQIPLKERRVMLIKYLKSIGMSW